MTVDVDSKSTPKRPWQTKSGAVALAFLAAVIIGCGSSTGGDEGDGGTNTAAKPQKPSVSVEAAAMVKEFEDNELSADAKYKGKWIEVTGTVNKIDTEVFDTDKYVLKIGSGEEFELLTVDCEDIPKDALSTINKGDPVKAVGKFKDGGDLGVTLEHCRLA